MKLPPARIRLLSTAALLVLLAAAVFTWRSLEKPPAPGSSAPAPAPRDTPPANRPAAAAAPAPRAPAPALPFGLPLDEVPVLRVALDRDRDELLEEAAAISERGIYRFAAPLPVSVDPENSGAWDRLPGGRLRWRLVVESPGALSLNFGFTGYRMPAGGALRIAVPGAPSRHRDFTEADNEDHRQLWTPLVPGDRVLLEVELPGDATRDALALELTRVNHGFRPVLASADAGEDLEKIGFDNTGDCHVDVVCTEGDIGEELIEHYRDQMRSAAAYTIQGVDACSGALVNNTALDGTPYFLTAEHCGIEISNAPTVVVYWNFENSTCRAIGSAANRSPGDGDLTQFNTGAIHRADNPYSDFSLIELDDPVPTSHGIFYSGWSRSPADATMAVGIHHPHVAEKRISFECDPVTTTAIQGTVVPDVANAVRVEDWDLGSTEGGSSGSPLFDQDGRIIGQLWGGNANCTNDLDDWYGRLSKSWDHGSLPQTRLSDWLDPIGTGLLALDGAYFEAVVSIDDVAVSEGDSGTATAIFTLTLDASPASPVSVAWATDDDTAANGVDYATAGGTVNFAAGETSKTVSVDVFGDVDTEEHDTFKVLLSNSSGLAIGDGEGIGTILNDDYITPVITSPLNDTANRCALYTYATTALNTPTNYAFSGAVPAGMTIGAATGLISWIPPATGMHTVDIVASNPHGMDQVTLSIDVGPESAVLAALDQDPYCNAISDGPFPWISTAAQSVKGGDSARSGVISHNGSSWFEVTVTGPDTLVFSWKVSSEKDYDFLRYYLDGFIVKAISGEVDWNREILDVPPGQHVIRFEYTKDESDNGGSDRGWIDDLLFASDFPHPILLSSLNPSRPLGGLTIYEAVTSLPADTITVTGLPAGLVADPDGVVRETGAVTPGTHPLTVTVANALGSEVRTVDLELLADAAVAAAALDVETLDLAFATPAGAAWTSQSAVTHDGADALRPPPIAHGQSTDLALAVVGPGTISFWWKASSETNYDLLEFYIDESRAAAISGDSAWVRIVREIPPGTRELTWRYYKDGAVSQFSDTGYVDEITFGGYAFWIACQQAGQRAGLHIDAELDGYPNISDYFFDQGAMTPDPHGVPALSFDPGTGNYRLTMPKRSGVTDVGAALEVSTGDGWSTSNTGVYSETATELILEETYSTPKPGTIYLRAVLAPK